MYNKWTVNVTPLDHTFKLRVVSNDIRREGNLICATRSQALNLRNYLLPKIQNSLGFQNFSRFSKNLEDSQIDSLISYKSYCYEVTTCRCGAEQFFFEKFVAMGTCKWQMDVLREICTQTWNLFGEVDVAAPENLVIQPHCGPTHLKQSKVLSCRHVESFWGVNL